MPVFALELRAALHNVSEVSAPADYSWAVRFRCGACGEITPSPMPFSVDDVVPLVRGGQPNLAYKCRLCERRSEVYVRPGEHRYAGGGWGRFAAFECRGCEPTLWQIDEALDVLGDDGFVFPDAEIDGGEFYGYDERLNQDASVTDFEHRFVRL